MRTPEPSTRRRLKVLGTALAGLVAVWAALVLASPPAAALGVGDPAPDIAVQGTDGKAHTLRDGVGKRWTVVAWYPMAATSG